MIIFRQLTDAEKLRKVVVELVDTERTYVKHLGYLMQVGFISIVIIIVIVIAIIIVIILIVILIHFVILIMVTLRRTWSH